MMDFIRYMLFLRLVFMVLCRFWILLLWMSVEMVVLLMRSL